ncbi:hypothetical protein [Leifsonia sp. AG29]|uniref:hypothetical protein n=1 Tax=Leifsonia sp. AG29 TaxID=2598860 RepID=UPI00131DB942|nr:hypothetical protein [Leifsonia sp. AG29]
MSEPLFPEDSPEQTERRIERAWESLRSSRRDDPDRIQKAHDAYLSDPIDEETPAGSELLEGRSYPL